jgi:6-pyruvoyltetrahydropterin/6-carboxytetrahydropterin synthase
MKKIRITKHFDFEAGHALFGYDGKCSNLHGHSYKLSVTVIGSPIMDENNPKHGMVIDFTDLKKIVNSEIVDVFDHTTIFSKNNPHSELADELSRLGHAVIKVDYQPTTEMMLIDFAKKVGARLPDSVALFSIRLQETASSYAEWFASDNL